MININKKEVPHQQTKVNLNDFVYFNNINILLQRDSLSM